MFLVNSECVSVDSGPWLLPNPIVLLKRINRNHLSRLMKLQLWPSGYLSGLSRSIVVCSSNCIMRQTSFVLEEIIQQDTQSCNHAKCRIVVLDCKNTQKKKTQNMLFKYLVVLQRKDTMFILQQNFVNPKQVGRTAKSGFLLNVKLCSNQNTFCMGGFPCQSSSD